jgi:hypothetical protein
MILGASVLLAVYAGLVLVSPHLLRAEPTGGVGRARGG